MIYGVFTTPYMRLRPLLFWKKSGVLYHILFLFFLRFSVDT